MTGAEPQPSVGSVVPSEALSQLPYSTAGCPPPRALCAQEQPLQGGEGPAPPGRRRALCQEGACDRQGSFPPHRAPGLTLNVAHLLLLQVKS